MAVRKAYVIGSGPNGLMAAITLAQAGIPTTVLEAQSTLGGATRSSALTRPGFVHDVGSSVYPMAVASPAFNSLPLKEHGLEWIHPPTPLAHPMDDGGAVFLESSIAETAKQLGTDSITYRDIVEPWVRNWPSLRDEILTPMHFPHDPLLMARFGLYALRPASWITSTFSTARAQALFAGVAAHSVLPLNAWASAAVGWVLITAAHASGWPIAKGGAQRVSDALASYFRSLGGQIITGQRVASLNDVKDGDIVIADVTPRQLLRIAGDELPRYYTRQLESYRYGPGVFKMDWALSGPIPWTASGCSRAGTVHIGGTFEEIQAAESNILQKGDKPNDRPFVLLSQPSLFDPTRAPEGCHTAWAYCHVPNGSTTDMSAAIEAQIERYAPGFKSRILGRHAMNCADLERWDANLVGGDIGGGAQALNQLFLRPTPRLYRTPRKGLYLGSASTPPGGGVHGMSGYHAAKAALSDLQKTN